MIEVERDPMGMSGRRYTLSAPSDLDALVGKRRKLAARVPARVASVFRGFPDAMTALAKEAPLPRMARWLCSLRDAQCHLEIFEMPKSWGPDGEATRLRFRFDDAWAPSFSRRADRLPAAMPTLLRAVHRITGDIDTQWGGSGTLVAAKDMQTVSALVRTDRVLFAEQVAELVVKRPAIGRYRAVFEADGDWLCTDATGAKTLWLGGEWTGEPSRAMPPLAKVLDGLFRALLARKLFRPGL